MHVLDKAEHIPNDFISVKHKIIRRVVRSHSHNFFEIEFFIDGNGTHEIDGVSYPVRPNAIFLLSPAAVHKVNAPDAELITVMFQSEYDGEFFAFPHFGPDASPVFYPDSEDAAVLTPMLYELLKHHEADRRYAMLLLRCILHKLTTLHNSHPKEHLPLIQNTILYLLENFRKEITLESTASHFGFSKSYFSDLFLRQTGVNFKTYLDEIRFSHVKNLLASTDLPVGEIYLRAGFRDYANFARRFKQKYGMTPSDYRTSVE